MQLQRLITTRFCVWWSFFSIYIGLICLTEIRRRGLDEMPTMRLENSGYEPPRFVILLVLGLLPAGIAAACVGYFAWLARRLPPAWRTLLLSSLLAMLTLLAVGPFAFQYYKAHYSYEAQRFEALRAAQVAPGGLAKYMDDGNWQIRREAFLKQYQYRAICCEQLDSRDLPVVERILSEKINEINDFQQFVAHHSRSGFYRLFCNLIFTQLGNESPAELFAHWPAPLLVDALLSSDPALAKLDALTLSAADTAVLYEQFAAATAQNQSSSGGTQAILDALALSAADTAALYEEKLAVPAPIQDRYGVYGLIWLDLRHWQRGSLPRVFRYCDIFSSYDRTRCLGFAIGRIAVQLQSEITTGDGLHPADYAALVRVMHAYFKAPGMFIDRQGSKKNISPSVLLRWVLENTLAKHSVTAVLDEWHAQRTEVVKILLSAPVLSRLRTEPDWDSNSRAALRQALLEIPEASLQAPPLKIPLRYNDFHTVWTGSGWINAQLDLLRPGNLQALFALCQRMPVEREQRSSCFQDILNDLKSRRDYAGMHVADATEHRRDFAVLEHAIEELTQLTARKDVQFDARLALYKMRKVLLRPGEAAELLTAARDLDELIGYGETYRMQTLQWLMEEAHTEPPRYMPDVSDRFAIGVTAEAIGSRFKEGWECIRNNPEAAAVLDAAPEKACREIEAILAWIHGN